MKRNLTIVLFSFMFSGCFQEKDQIVEQELSTSENEVRATSSSCLGDRNPDSLLCECGIDPRGLTMLTDTLGLYTTGEDTMPSAHRAQGMIKGAQVVPLNSSGNPSGSGKIHVHAEGMSNALRVFDAFKTLLSASTLDNPKIVFTNKSLGGVDLQEWVDSLGVGAVDVRVQVVFMYHSLSKNFNGCSAQTYIDTTRHYLKQRVLQLEQKYPNLKQIYVQSREFGGWKCYESPGALAEPAAYYNGFGVRKFVDLQVSGAESALSYSNAPFIAWSIYPWDPTTPRSWFEGGGLHPCTTGSNVWAQDWFDFLLNDSTSRQWFAKNP